MCKVPKLFVVVNSILQKMNFMRLTLNGTVLARGVSVEEIWACDKASECPPLPPGRAMVSRAPEFSVGTS